MGGSMAAPGRASAGRGSAQPMTKQRKRDPSAVDEDERAVVTEFGRAVNMTATELERWLATDESKAVGQKRDGGESIGHESGRKIVELLKAKRSSLTEQDYAHMRKVIGYVHRHLAQRPSGDVEESRWRYSLMNWGHDPLK
jgi:Protein of unknown function (DUF3140)